MTRSDESRAPIFMVRTKVGVLAPAAAFDAERLDRIKIGDVVEVTIKKRRSLPQLRLYWAILGRVVENIDGYPTSDHLHDALKDHLGYVESFRKITGETAWRTQSAAFTAMEADEFQVFFDRSLDVLATLLGVDPMELLKEGKETI